MCPLQESLIDYQSDFFPSVLLICNSIHIHLVAGEGTVPQCLWQSRQFISRQKSPLRVSVLQWQQLNTCSEKSCLISVQFPPCYLLTSSHLKVFILLLIPGGIYKWGLQKVQLDLFMIYRFYDCLCYHWHILLYTYRYLD